MKIIKAMEPFLGKPFRGFSSIVHFTVYRQGRKEEQMRIEAKPG